MKSSIKLFVTILHIAITSTFSYNPVFGEAIQKEIVVKKEENIAEEAHSINKDFYLIGAGDIIDLKIYEASELSGEYEISNDGTINLPLVGSVYVNNKTIDQVSTLLQSKFSEQLLRPELYVKIVKYRPFKVSIIGEVVSPGVYTLKKDYNKNALNYNQGISGFPTLIDAIKKAGGIKSNTDISNISIKRLLPDASNEYKQAKINLLKLIKDGDQSQNPFIFHGDIIYLPKAKTENINQTAHATLSPDKITITVVGAVEDPGRLEVPLKTSLMQGILQAGGFKAWESNTHNVLLVRTNNNGSLNLKKFSLNTNKKIKPDENPNLENGDIVKVSLNSFSKVSKGITTLTTPMSGLITAISLFKLAD